MLTKVPSPTLTCMSAFSRSYIIVLFWQLYDAAESKYHSEPFGSGSWVTIAIISSIVIAYSCRFPWVLFLLFELDERSWIVPCLRKTHCCVARCSSDSGISLPDAPPLFPLL
ncbi:hypothetical protein V1522DRAFT_203306 [Lipomyces starkeyi]